MNLILDLSSMIIFHEVNSLKAFTLKSGYIKMSPSSAYICLDVCSMLLWQHKLLLGLFVSSAEPALIRAEIFLLNSNLV